MATPTGIITIWYGVIADIPSGWLLCNGSSGTPDLRNLFVRGAASDGEVGTTSGSSTHTHTSAPSLDSTGAHTHSFSGNTGGQTGGTSSGSGDPGSYAKSTAHSHSYSGTASSGGAHTHTVGTSGSATSLPPYYKLFYIMKS